MGEFQANGSDQVLDGWPKPLGLDITEKTKLSLLYNQHISTVHFSSPLPFC